MNDYSLKSCSPSQVKMIDSQNPNPKPCPRGPSRAVTASKRHLHCLGFGIPRGLSSAFQKVMQNLWHQQQVRKTVSLLATGCTGSERCTEELKLQFSFAGWPACRSHTLMADASICQRLPDLSRCLGYDVMAFWGDLFMRVTGTGLIGLGLSEQGHEKFGTPN